MRLHLSTTYNRLLSKREAKAEEDRPMMTMSIKADKTVKMGLIDIKLELRKAQAYKINIVLCSKDAEALYSSDN